MNIYLTIAYIATLFLIWSTSKRILDDRMRKAHPAPPKCEHKWETIYDKVHPSYADMAYEKDKEFTFFVAKNFTRRHELILMCPKCGAIEDLSSDITPKEKDAPDMTYPTHYTVRGHE